MALSDDAPWNKYGGAPAEVYERYRVPAMFVPWSDLLLEAAAPRPGERVLDVACGTGIVARRAAERVRPGGRVTGLDLNAGMLAVAPRARGAGRHDRGAAAVPGRRRCRLPPAEQPRNCAGLSSG